MKKKIFIIISSIFLLLIISPHILFWYISSIGDRYLPEEKLLTIKNEFSDELLNIFWISLGGQGEREMVPIKLHHFIKSYFNTNIYTPLNKSSRICSAVARLVSIEKKQKIMDWKIEQLSLTTWISKNWHIDKALRIYINLTYYGQGIYGIKQASNHYFNKSSDKLTIKEMAVLSALPNAPNVYLKNHKLHLKKSNLVLKKLGKNIEIKKLPIRFIKQSSINQAKESKIP